MAKKKKLRRERIQVRLIDDILYRLEGKPISVLNDVQAYVEQQVELRPDVSNVRFETDYGRYDEPILSVVGERLETDEEYTERLRLRQIEEAEKKAEKKLKRARSIMIKDNKSAINRLKADLDRLLGK